LSQPPNDFRIRDQYHCAEKDTHAGSRALAPTLPSSHVQAKPQYRQLNQNCGHTETRGILTQSIPYWVASEKAIP
jgi:hypothetical protein